MDYQLLCPRDSVATFGRHPNGNAITTLPLEFNGEDTIVQIAHVGVDRLHGSSPLSRNNAGEGRLFRMAFQRGEI
ncbi:hypothetical protein LPU83_pLPU83c_0399 (plasmid) [Rhizobium favelukesii]|uniref:Uncharacterized protein n=1 Tax=Rhizobium favelukesii TaxID=348824 RepID=W6S3R5_9HYPH|nr:hypothetical protein LPU83_pLPU83c_0399 [Rhizobium favelukesii]